MRKTQNVKTTKYDKTHENIYILKIQDPNSCALQVLVCETVYHQKDVMVNGFDIQHILSPFVDTDTISIEKGGGCSVDNHIVHERGGAT